MKIGIVAALVLLFSVGAFAQEPVKKVEKRPVKKEIKKATVKKTEPKKQAPIKKD